MKTSESILFPLVYSSSGSLVARAAPGSSGGTQGGQDTSTGGPRTLQVASHAQRWNPGGSPRRRVQTPHRQRPGWESAVLLSHQSHKESTLNE